MKYYFNPLPKFLPKMNFRVSFLPFYEDELIADHHLADEMTDKLRKDILAEDDPYENGYIGNGTIEIEIDEKGNAKLSKSLSFHCGQ